MAAIETPLRRAARGPLPGVLGAFLRTDRGDALYVSDALRRGMPLAPLAPAYDAIGFNAAENDGLLYLTPRDAWMPRVTDVIYKPEYEDEQSRLLARLSSRDIAAFETELWLNCVKCAEGALDPDALFRRVREAAAVCLRAGMGGGSLIHSYMLLKACK